jgi:hypothetical protein
MPSASKSELRKFGLTVGPAFIVLGGISWWRGHEIAPLVLWSIGTLLLIPGLLFPAALGPVHNGWMQMAAFLGHWNTRIILTLLYYVVFTPVGFIMTLFHDPLNRSWKDSKESNWIKRPPRPVDPATYERQF